MQAPREPTRTILNRDALSWLESSPPLEGCSLVTSLPDFGEMGRPVTLDEWKAWFVGAAELVLDRCPDDGVAVFFQSDIRHEGAWVDKGFLCQKAAERTGHALLWHKIVCRLPAGRIAYGRAGYSHLLCFSRGARVDAAGATADVLPEAGKVTWTRGMGVEACLVACRFILDHTRTRTVVDPFCGHGTVLAVANSLGLDAIGVELGASRARKARTLEYRGGKLRGIGGARDSAMR